MVQKEGPVSDAKWSPANAKGSGQFVVVCGTMPAIATLYDLKAKPIFDFGMAHRNTVSWSPHGRFLCLAGFGNLAGDMDFWDVNKKEKLGSNNSHCAVRSRSRSRSCCCLLTTILLLSLRWSWVFH